MSGNLDKSQHAPTVPDILYSDDPLASGKPEHSVTKPNTDQTLAPPAIFTRTPEIRQTRSKQARPMYSGEDPVTETNREVELPNPNISIPTNPSGRRRRHGKHTQDSQSMTLLSRPTIQPYLYKLRRKRLHPPTSTQRLGGHGYQQRHPQHRRNSNK